MTSSVISSKITYFIVPKVKKSIICDVEQIIMSCWSVLKFYVKGRHNLPEIINFFVICANLQKFT